MKNINHFRAKSFRKFSDGQQVLRTVKSVIELVSSGELTVAFCWISHIHDDTHTATIEFLVSIEGDQAEVCALAKEAIGTLSYMEDAGFNPAQFIASSWTQIDSSALKRSSLRFEEKQTINSTFELIAEAKGELAYCFELSKARPKDHLREESLRAMRSALWSSEYELQTTVEDRLSVKTSLHSPTGEASNFILNLLSLNVFLGQGLVKRNQVSMIMPLPKISEFSRWLKVETLPVIKNAIRLSNKGLILGDQYHFDGQSKPLRAELTNHHAVFGASGAGKSTHLLSIAQSAIEAADRALVVLDPHGSLALDILERVPQSEHHRVIYIDIADSKHSMGLNLLDSRSDEDLSYSIGELDQMFLQTYGPEIWGPRLSDIFRNTAMLAGLSTPPKTMIDILALAELDSSQLALLLSSMKRPIPSSVQTYLQQIKRQANGVGSLKEAISYFRAKLSPITDNLFMRQILGQAKTTIPFEEAFKNRQIIIFNLDKGRLSARYSSLLGKMLASKMLQTVMRSKSRSPVLMMIDEFSNFNSETFSIALSEGRKYGLSLCLASQTVAQLQNNGFEIGAHQDLLASVLNNVGSLASFRVSHIDALMMAPYFGEEIKSSDLSQLPNFHAICRFTAEVCSELFKTRQLSPTLSSQSINMIIEESKRRYTKPRGEIDKEIQDRLYSSNSLGKREVNQKINQPLL